MREIRARMGWLAVCLVCSVSGSVRAATVTLTPSATTVAKGSQVTLTATVSPGTAVQKVTFTYEGETGQDEVTSAPYVVTRAFGTAADAVTVTATASFTDGTPDAVDTADLDVVGLVITGSPTPARGATLSYTAQSATPGKAVEQFNWSYSNDTVTNTLQDSDADGDDKSSWGGRMVVDGTLTCTAVVAGVNASDSLVVTITPRNWTTPITCAEDNEAEWGEDPVPDAVLGQHRDRDSDVPGYYFVPRTSTASFAAANSLNQVPSGPCAGVCWVLASILKCQRETVINKHLKGEPEFNGETFPEVNDRLGCFYPSAAADFLLAVKHHEYRGPDPGQRSIYGHHGRTEVQILDTPGRDPKAAIESMVDTTVAGLRGRTDAAICNIEDDIELFASDEVDMTNAGVNWGPNSSLGSGLNARWMGDFWSACEYGPERF